MSTETLQLYASALEQLSLNEPRLLAGDEVQAAKTVREAEAAADLATRVTEEGDYSSFEERDALIAAASADLALAGRFLATADNADPKLTDANEPILFESVDEDMNEMARAIRAALAQERVGLPKPPADQPPMPGGDHTDDFQALVDRILKTGGGAIGDLIGAVGWSVVGGTVASRIEAATAASDAWWSALVGGLTKWFEKLRRAALRLFKAGVDKLVKLIGSDALDAFVKKIETAFDGWIKSVSDDDHGGLPGYIVGNLVGASVVADACDAMIAGRGDEVARKALEAGGEVAEHGEKLATWVGRAAALTKWAGPSLWSSPAAPYLAGGVLVTIAAAAWQVQDHVDTRVPFALPDTSVGLQRAVAATASNG